MRGFLCRSRWATLLLAACFVADAAFADEPSDDSSRQGSSVEPGAGSGEGSDDELAQGDVAPSTDAKRAFDEGRDLVQRGAYEAACAKFESAYKLYRGVGVLLNLADCYERLGRLASAAAAFEQAKKLAEEQGDARGELAAARYAALAPRLVHATLSAQERPPDGYELFLNGQKLPRSEWGKTLARDRGKYVLSASAPGHDPVARTFELDEEDVELVAPRLTERVITTLDPASSEPIPGPCASPPAEPLWSPARIVAAGLGGLGVVAGGASLGFAFASADARRDAQTSCIDRGDFLECDAAGVSAGERARSHGDASTAFLVTSGLLLSSGVVLWFVNPGGAAAASDAAVVVDAVRIASSATAASVTLSGSF